MPNILIISLEGFSFSSRQMYPQLFPVLLSRTAVHESVTPDDALSYISAGWPNIILVSDPAITREENRHLLSATIDWMKHGCTLILMGFFASTVQHDDLNATSRGHFQVRWRFAEYTSHEVRLHDVDEHMVRRASLVPNFHAKAVYLGHVSANEVVYTGGEANLAYAAFVRIGLGKLGYVGDVNFGEELERLILAMNHLDRPEDSFQTE